MLFKDFRLLESRNADSETTGGPALLSINIFEQRLPGASRASRGCSRPSCTRTPGYSSGWYIWWLPVSIFQLPVSIFSFPFQYLVSIFRLPVPKLERLNPKVPPRLDFRALWALILEQFSAISDIILVAVLNEFVNINFQLFVIQTTEIHVFTRV